jgi:hypothetical protein
MERAFLPPNMKTKPQPLDQGVIVSSGTISNCFKKAVICKDAGVREDWEDDDILLSDLKWCKFKE